MDFHVFRKPKKLKNGKTVHRWYYYYIDENGRQVQKACKGCKTRKDAEDYIRALENAGAEGVSLLIKDIAKEMFVLGGEHTGRLAQLGRRLDISSLVSNRRFIKLIIERWGDRTLASINPTEITDYLFGVERSGGWKNRYQSIFGEIYAEAQWRGCKLSKPQFQSFALKTKKADIFTTDELNRLFVPTNFISDMFYTMFLLCLSGGMRLGEARAVRPKQMLFDRKAVIVDGFCKQDGRRTDYNKKGSPDNPRHRIALLPDFTLGKVAEYLAANTVDADGFLFQENGRAVTQDRAQYAFEKAVKTAGIERDGRKLVCHSLRYTYVTRMRRELPAETVMKMVGHTNIGMTDYYTNKRALDESLAALTGAGQSADKLFS